MSDDSDPRIGRTIGTFTLTRLIDEGGMGAVFEAWDDKLQRRVAVKAVHPRYRRDLEARRRFLREARLLSKVQHPNICQIYEHLESEDGDYLVLELIEGRSLRQVFKAGGLERGTRMGCARQLAAALVAAHDKGVVHRDLKPANVMLTPDGTVKVLDFGLARTLSSGPMPPLVEWTDSGSVARPALGDLSIQDTLPASQASIEGTVAYMSPEQARGEPATPASDVYSLGLILQEVFTGQPPYEKDLPLAVQIIKVGQAETLPVRGLGPELTRLIERTKSLAPGSRPSAVDVAERLRWIERAPRRRARRVAVAAFVVLLSIFAAVMALQRQRIAEEAARANREAETARQVSDFLVDVFAVSDPWNPDAGATMTARELLDRSARKIRAELDDQPLTRARLLTTMGLVHRKLGLFDQAETLLEEAVELQSGDRGDPLETAASLDELARLYSDQGRYDEAHELFEESIAIREDRLGRDDPRVAASVHDLGYLYYRKGQLDRAEPLYVRALEIRRRAFGENNRDVADSLNDLALLYRDRGDAAKAEELQLRARAIREAILPPDHPELALSYANLAALYYDQGDFARAEPLFRRDLEISEKALGPDHPDVAISHNNLAVLYRERGDYALAEPHLMRSFEIREKVLGPDHPSVGVGLHNLGSLYRDLGEYEKAEAAYQRSLEIWEMTWGEEHVHVAASLQNRGELYLRWGRAAEAERVLDRARAIVEKLLGPDHFRIVATLESLAEARAGLGRPGAAEDGYTQALAMSERLLTGDPENRILRLYRAVAHQGLGDLAAGRGDEIAARGHWRQAADIVAPIAAHTDSVSHLHAHAMALLSLGRREEARPLVEKLLAKGWRRPQFLTLCRRLDLLPLP